MSIASEEDKDRILRLLEAGNLAEARPLCQAWLRRSENADAWRILGVIAGREAKLPEAERCFREALARNAADSKAMTNLAHVLRAQDRPEEAEDYLRQALRICPDYAEAHHAMGSFLSARGEYADAEAAWREAVRLMPEHADAHFSLGLLLEARGEIEAAAASLRRAVRLRPDWTGAHRELGLFYARQRRLLEAEASLRDALRLEPRDTEVQYRLAAVLKDQGRSDEAERAFRRVLDLEPTHANAHISLAVALEKRARYEEALALLERALALNPQSVEAYTNLGIVCTNLGRIEQAITSYREATRLNPCAAKAHYNLAVLCAEHARHDEGLSAARTALRLKPDYVLAHGVLANLHIQGGLIDEAIAGYQQALALASDAGVYSNMLFALNHHAGASPEAIYRQHRLWGERYGHVTDALPALGNRPDPDRPLRIGYVSPDFRSHSVAFFIEPVLTHHDRSRFEVYCYSELSEALYDETTTQLRSLANRWRSSLGLNDRALAEQIRADGIDLLVDLAGHTSRHRLLAFAYRPAPLQLSYLGYCNTTGLPTMDYRLTDEWADPAGQEAFHTEQLVRLPRGFLCYQPPHDAPVVSTLPAYTAGYFTFGSFNALGKITPEVVALWASILAAVPGSRLVLKNRTWNNNNGTSACARYLAMFETHGITCERVEFVGWMPSRTAHLDLYGRIDLALDTFPYNGTTTTCEALWMGVPVITLAGDRHAGRVGVSLLTRIGLTEFIAQTHDEYVKLAVQLAGDNERLGQQRAEMRERMKQSTLCDAAAFTADLEQAYREMWIKWCEQN